MSREPVLPRRRLLAGALALPVAAAAAIVPAVAAPNPDAELLELGRQHAEADAQYDALDARCEAAYLTAEAAYPAAPEVLRPKSSDGIAHFDAARLLSDGFYNAEGIRRWRAYGTGGPYIWPLAARERFEARRAQVLAAWDEWVAAKEVARAAAGVPELEEQLDALGYKVTALEDRIFEFRAKTLAGYRLKARLASRVVVDGHSPDGTYEDRVVRSLLADLTAEEA